MDESITKVLQAVQEEFPRNRLPRRQSSAQSGSSASNARKAASIPIADDRMFPTSDDLSLYTAGEFSPSSHLDEEAIAASPTSNPRFSTSPNPSSGSFSGVTPSIQEEASSAGEQTPRASHQGNLNLSSANQYEAESTTPSYFTSIEKPVPASSDASPTATSSGSGAQQQTSDTTMTSAGEQSNELSAGNSSNTGTAQAQFTSTNIPRSSRNATGPSFIDLPPSRNQASGGFSLSSNKSDNILLTPGGDDIPFTFKRKSALTRPLESPEIVA